MSILAGQRCLGCEHPGALGILGLRQPHGGQGAGAPGRGLGGWRMAQAKALGHPARLWGGGGPQGRAQQGREDAIRPLGPRCGLSVLMLRAPVLEETQMGGPGTQHQQEAWSSCLCHTLIPGLGQVWYLPWASASLPAQGQSD